MYVRHMKMTAQWLQLGLIPIHCVVTRDALLSRMSPITTVLSISMSVSFLYIVIQCRSELAQSVYEAPTDPHESQGDHHPAEVQY